MMKKKYLKILILIVSTLSCTAAYASAKNQTMQDPPKGQLEIDKYISQLRQSIESNYAARLTELQERRQAAVRLLDVADKDVYALLAERAQVAKTVLQINDYGFNAPRYLQAKTEGLLQPKGLSTHRNLKDRLSQSCRQFADAECLIAQRKNEVLAGFGWAFAELEKEKKYALSVRLAALEGQLKDSLAAGRPEPTHGTVTGIIYSEDRPVVLVNGEILRQGDKTSGVTVLKIHPDQVEFKKAAKTWTQKVQQPPPAAYWD
jgi:hypothetical protein